MALDEGTGIVHIAPGCGAEDFELGQREGLATIVPVDESGAFYDGFGWLHGVHTADAAHHSPGPLPGHDLLQALFQLVAARLAGPDRRWIRRHAAPGPPAKMPAMRELEA